jgi:Ni,Fe-hydrogenase III small subunit/formate hydrogenlyase subunit 6/NADH:ubiquinone oxidoreductase subunit I
MRDPLWSILRAGLVTQREICPDLAPDATGLPQVTEQPCDGTSCGQCVAVCPTEAIRVANDDQGGAVELDRGRCIGCGECLAACPTGTLAPDRSTRTAVRSRSELVLMSRAAPGALGSRLSALGPTKASARHLAAQPAPARAESREPRAESRPFRRSLQIREVSTGCNATDLEVAAINNPIFDVARFGAQFVASPRFADALLVTGPVARGMQEPLRRCYEAMAEPRLVIAVGTCAISGGVHRGGYAGANGVAEILPVAVYVPGCSPHPWSIIHAILLAMGRYAE